MNRLADKLKTPKVLMLLTAAAFLAVVVIYYIYSNQNNYGNHININNYDSLIKNLSKDRKDSISAALYNTLKLNGIINPQLSSINDALIRNGSNLQTYDSISKVYSGSFIVDIASTKQSYMVSYIYPTDSSSSTDTAGYTVLISCLPADKLIYGNFNCRDISSTETGGIDPFTKYLPKSTLDYQIKALTDSKGKITTLKIQLFLTDADYRTGADVAIASYKSEALNWIKSVGFNPDNYNIEYSY